MFAPNDVPPVILIAPPLPPSVFDTEVPDPALILTLPPIPPTAEETPASMFRFPPVAMSPSPTRILISPPEPLVASDEARRTDPVLPFDEVPDLKRRSPLMPVVPALAVWKSRAPLVERGLYPDVMTTAPPVFSEDAPVAPAFISREEPTPLPLEPTEMLISPADAAAAVPVPRETEPELNSLALVSPETRETPPDTPAVPPLAVLSARDPEDVATERPEVNEMEPPVAVAASPPVNLE